MKPDLAKLVVCIKCGSSDFELVPVKKEGEEIIEGLMICKKCGYTYAIVDSILRTIDDEVRRKTLEKYREFIPEELKKKARRRTGALPIAPKSTLSFLSRGITLAPIVFL